MLAVELLFYLLKPVGDIKPGQSLYSPSSSFLVYFIGFRTFALEGEIFHIPIPVEICKLGRGGWPAIRIAAYTVTTGRDPAPRMEDMYSVGKKLQSGGHFPVTGTYSTPGLRLATSIR